MAEEVGEVGRVREGYRQFAPGRHAECCNGTLKSRIPPSYAEDLALSEAARTRYDILFVAPIISRAADGMQAGSGPDADRWPAKMSNLLLPGLVARLSEMSC